MKKYIIYIKKKKKKKEKEKAKKKDMYVNALRRQHPPRRECNNRQCTISELASVTDPPPIRTPVRVRIPSAAAAFRCTGHPALSPGKLGRTEVILPSHS